MVSLPIFVLSKRLNEPILLTGAVVGLMDSEVFFINFWSEVANLDPNVHGWQNLGRGPIDIAMY